MAAGSRVQPQALPADVSTVARTNSHSTASSRTIRALTRTGWMYSQDRMRVRWIRGRVRRVARVGLPADGLDEGAVTSVCVYTGCLLWPTGVRPLRPPI